MEIVYLIHLCHFEKEKVELIEKAIIESGKDNYYIYHDRFCSNNNYDMKWNVCIIVLSEPDSNNNSAAERLIRQLNSVGLNNEIIINSNIELKNNGNTITVELPLVH